MLLRLLRCFVASLLRCFVASLLRCFVASLLRCFVASLLRCFVASLLAMAICAGFVSVSKINFGCRFVLRSYVTCRVEC